MPPALHAPGLATDHAYRQADTLSVRRQAVQADRGVSRAQTSPSAGQPSPVPAFSTTSCGSSPPAGTAGSAASSA